MKKSNRLTSMWVVLSGLCVAFSAGGAALLLAPTPTLTLPTGEVLPPVVLAGDLVYPDNSIWSQDAVALIEWVDASGKTHVDRKLLHPDQNGHVAEVVYMAEHPENTPIELRIMGDTVGSDCTMRRVFIDAETGRGAFFRGTVILADSGEYQLSFGTLSMALPPAVGNITLAPPLAINGVVYFEPGASTLHDPLHPSGTPITLVAGTTHIEMYSWGVDNSWWALLQLDGLSPVSHVSAHVRRGAQMTLSGDFGSSLNGLVNLAAYPMGRFVILVADFERIEDTADEIEVATFVFEFAGISRYSTIDSSTGAYGEIDATAGNYHLEIWGKDTSDSFERFYSQPITLVPGHQVLDIN